jgi:hypothetical protein
MLGEHLIYYPKNWKSLRQYQFQSVLNPCVTKCLFLDNAPLDDESFGPYIHCCCRLHYFSKPSLLFIQCNIHTLMLAHLFLLDLMLVPLLLLASLQFLATLIFLVTSTHQAGKTLHKHKQGISMNTA